MSVELGGNKSAIPRYEIPRDEQDSDYVKSFTVEQVEEYKKVANTRTPTTHPHL